MSYLKTPLDLSKSAQIIGNLATSNLNSGTSASSSTFWRGDGTWAAPSSTLTPGYFTGWYYSPAVTHPNSSGTTALTTGIIYTQMWYFPQSVSFDRLNINITSAASSGKHMKLGRYNCANGVPTTLAQDYGTALISSPGVNDYSISDTVPAGYWYFGYILEENSSYTTFSINQFNNVMPTQSLTGRNNGPSSGLTFTGTYAGGLTDLTGATASNNNTNLDIQFRKA